MLGIVRLDQYIILDIVKAFFGQTNFEINAFYHHDPLLTDEKILCRISMSRQINALNNLFNHEAQLEWLKLITVVHSHHGESRLGHGGNQSEQK